MFNARFFFALMVLAGAALAACSGNLGAGTSAPGGLLPSGPLSGVVATASPTPNSANDIVTYGDSVQFQPLPQVGGYGGAIAFEAPNPRPSGFQAVPIGATLSVVLPSDTPDLNLASAEKKTTRARRARALAYITLLATHDVTLSTYPRLAIDVPRDIVTTYREDEINVAFYNSGAKDKTFKLAVVDHDTASPPPAPSPGLTAPPPPTAIPLTEGSPGAIPSNVPAGFPTGALTPAPTLPGGGAAPRGAAPLVSATLPPQRLLFAATPVTLKLTANSPAVFAIYALPVATPSPSPSPSPSASASGSAAAASASRAPAATSTASAAASTAPSPSAAPSASP